jgi:ribosomal-protein-alanine N-acetyltransferase
MYLNFSPFPKLKTERLELRKLNLQEDVQAVFELLSNEENQRYLKRPLTQSIEEAKQHILRMNKGVEDDKWLVWAIEKEEKLIGTICLWNFASAQNSGEIGYELHPDFKGQGYMSEAIQAVMQYGIEAIGLEQFRAITEAENQSSIKLLKRHDYRLKKILSDEEKRGMDINKEAHLYVNFPSHSQNF